MDSNLRRAYLIELIGTFALVYISAGVVCVNHMTTPSGQQPGTASLAGHQPGLVGIALAQGLILAAALAVTVPLSGGYLNPAITLMLWVFNRLDHRRTAWFVGAQAVGAALAAFCLRHTFDEDILLGARVGTPHLNLVVYRDLSFAALAAGTGVELVLTFFLVFAIFGTTQDGSRPDRTGLMAGLTLTACVLFGFALTGAATNPARWFGPALSELLLPGRLGRACELLLPGRTQSPFADVFVYLAGPVLGALLAGLVYFKLLLPARTAAAAPAETPARPAETPRPAPARARK
jgi:glycerol uptake facilitator protein